MHNLQIYGVWIFLAHYNVKRSINIINATVVKGIQSENPWFISGVWLNGLALVNVIVMPVTFNTVSTWTHFVHLVKAHWINILHAQGPVIRLSWTFPSPLLFNAKKHHVDADETLSYNSLQDIWFSKLHTQPSKLFHFHKRLYVSKLKLNFCQNSILFDLVKSVIATSSDPAFLSGPPLTI